MYAEATGSTRPAANAATLSVLPSSPPPTARQSLTADETRNLLETDQDELKNGEWRPERLEAVVVVGITVGLRPGELTGLLWSDLDLDSDLPTLIASGR